METVAAGLVSLTVDVAGQYGITPERLWSHAGSAPVLAEPDALIPRQVLFDVLRALAALSGDPGLGLRMAERLDLRRQGMWGYAVLASMSMRERIECYRRYQALRMPAEFRVHVAGDHASFDVESRGLPADLKPLLLDFAFAATCANHRKRIARAGADIHVWLSYPERPHHRALRALAGGPTVFDAPLDRLQLPAADLELTLPGDPHLAKLAHLQLEHSSVPPRPHSSDFMCRLRELLESDLAGGATHQQLARRMGMSARTLRRRVQERGTSFQVVLDEVRYKRALALLAEPTLSVDEVARTLGYADSSNFRRAFRRWTGQPPRAYRRAEQLGPK